MSERSLKLLEILRTRFNLDELQLLCFELQVEFDDLSGEGRQAKARELLEYLERRGQLDKIVAYLGNQRKDIRLADYGLHYEEIHEPEDVFSIVFFNRDHELQLLTSPFGPPYVLIDAPAGYGKSRLLQELKARYDSLDSWACALIDFRQGPLRESKRLVVNALGGQIVGYRRPSVDSDVEDYVDRFVGALNDAPRGVVLLFDSVEELGTEMITWLLYDLAVYAFQELGRIGFGRERRKFQAIFAGRYEADRWSKLTHGRLASSIQPLTPFDLDAVMVTAREVTRRVHAILRDADIRLVSNSIMRFTGGHPGCMAAILRELADHQFVGQEHYFGQEGRNRVYTSIVSPVIQEVKQGIPEPLRPIFETLSVFRRFNYETFRYMIEHKEIQWQPKSQTDQDLAWSLFTEVTGTHLVQWNDGFYSDGIVRRLLTIEMRQEEPERFRRLCERAETFYRERLQSPHAKVPYLLAIEITYQQLQVHMLDEDLPRDEVIQQVRTTLNGYLDDAENPYDRQERLNDLAQALRRDWEWKYLANIVLGSGGDQVILEQIVEDLPLETVQEVQMTVPPGTDVQEFILPEPVLQVTASLESDIQEFTLSEQEIFIVKLSEVVCVKRDQIRILEAVPGSVQVTLEMPEEAANRLVSMYLADASVLRELGIVKVELRKVNVMPDTSGQKAETNAQQPTEGLQTGPMRGPVDLAQLRRVLSTHFNESELRALCFDLKVDFEILSGEGKGDKVRELLAYLQRRGRIPDLLEVGKRLRPDVPWE